ncbi:MAG: PilZ domain-containing protein [Candidatus Methylomirabilales bacterium]
MNQMENRDHPRFPLRMPVLCEGLPGSDYRTLGLTQNVSHGGLLLAVPRLVVPGTPVNLRLLTGDRISRAEAGVVWTADTSSGLMGVRLTSLNSVDRLAWEHLITFQAGPTPRASLRIPIDLEVTCLLAPDTRLPGRVENLSDGGMMIVLPQAVTPQTRVRVVVPAWLILPPVEAEVMWTRANPAVQGVVHGLHFLASDMGKELFLIGTLLRQLLH